MSTSLDSEGLDAIVLAGGQGTRLRTVVSDRQKVMAKVGNRPFLFNVIEQLIDAGIQRVTLCLGYLSESVKLETQRAFGASISLRFSVETSPLGTGGAVILASELGISNDFLVLNGDSFANIDLQALSRFHSSNANDATMAIISVENSARYGRVRMDSDSNITAFEEKSNKPRKGLINAGIYIFNQSVLALCPAGAFSLEADLFPVLIDHRFKGVRFEGSFIDIGVPEDFLKAQTLQF